MKNLTKEEVIKEIRNNRNLSYAEKVQMWNDAKTSSRLEKEDQTKKFSLTHLIKRICKQTYNLLRHGNRFYIKPYRPAKTDIQPDHFCITVKDELLEKRNCCCKNSDSK